MLKALGDIQGIHVLLKSRIYCFTGDMYNVLFLGYYL